MGGRLTKSGLEEAQSRHSAMCAKLSDATRVRDGLAAELEKAQEDALDEIRRSVRFGEHNTILGAVSAALDAAKASDALSRAEAQNMRASAPLRAAQAECCRLAASCEEARRAAEAYERDLDRELDWQVQWSGRPFARS